MRQTNVFCIVLGPSVVSFVHMRTTPLSSGIPARIIRRIFGKSYFQSALSTHDRLHAPYWLAMTRLDYSDYLIDRRVPDHARATEFIGLAIDAAHEFGYGALERRGRAALGASRGQG